MAYVQRIFQRLLMTFGTFLHFRVLFFFSLRVLCDLRYIHNEPHLWSNPEGPIKPVRRQKIGIESLSTQVLTSTKRTNSFSVTTQAHSE